MIRVGCTRSFNSQRPLNSRKCRFVSILTGHHTPTQDMGIVSGAAKALGLELGATQAARDLFDEGGRGPPLADADFAALTLLLDPDKETPVI